MRPWGPSCPWCFSATYSPTLGFFIFSLVASRVCFVSPYCLLPPPPPPVEVPTLPFYCSHPVLLSLPPWHSESFLTSGITYHLVTRSFPGPGAQCGLHLACAPVTPLWDQVLVLQRVILSGHEDTQSSNLSDLISLIQNDNSVISLRIVGIRSKSNEQLNTETLNKAVTATVPGLRQ